MTRWRSIGERTKYGNIPGDGFPSRKEAARYRELLLLEKAGQITGLRRQVPFPLGGKPEIRYIADFVYLQGDKQIAEDSKGFHTAVFKLKAAFFRERYPDWELKIT